MRMAESMPKSQPVPIRELTFPKVRWWTIAFGVPFTTGGLTEAVVALMPQLARFLPIGASGVTLQRRDGDLYGFFWAGPFAPFPMPTNR